MASYDDDGNKITKKGFIEILVQRGAEEIRTEVPEGSTISALIEDGHLRGVNVANTRLNNAPAGSGDTVYDGDTVTQVPRSGKQG
jgi:hypothetical protein